MPIHFRCKCGKAFVVADDYAGRYLSCPVCKIRLVVPGEATAREPKPAAPPPKAAKPSPPKAPEKPTSPAADELELAVEEPPPPVDAVKDFGLDKAAKTPSPPAAPELELLGEPPPPRPDPVKDFGGRPSAAPPAAAQKAKEEGETYEMELAQEAAPPAVDPYKDFGAQAPPAAESKAPLAEAPASPIAPLETEEDGVFETEEAAPPKGNVCAKCGAALEEGAILCTNCGVPVRAAGVAAAPASAARKKQKLILIGAAAGGLVLVLAIIAFFVFRRGRPEPQPTPPVAEAPPAETPPPPTETAPKPQVVPEPPPKAAWAGFADANLLLRDRLESLAAKMREYQAKQGRPIAKVADLALPPEMMEGLALIETGDMAPDRFRPLARQAQPSPSGESYVLFSDATVRLVSARELERALPRPTPAGWMTAADRDLLAAIAPSLRVVNKRFKSLEVMADGKTIGRLSKGTSASFPLDVGEHEIVFKSGDAATPALKARFDRGIIYEYAFLLYQDIPPIPVRTYRRALDKRAEGYTINTDDPASPVLQGPGETVRLARQTGRPSISANFLEITATIERPGLRIAGLDNAPIRVSPYSGLEEGKVEYTNGAVALYRRTELGTVRIQEKPNTEIAALARIMPQAPKAAPRPATPRAPGLSPHGPGPLPDMPPPDVAPPEEQMMDFGAAPEYRSQRAPVREAVFPAREFRAAPDARALEPIFARTAPDAVPRLLAQARLILEWLKAGGRADLTAPEMSLQDLCATLAVYGDLRAGTTLTDLNDAAKTRPAGYPELLLAMARCSKRMAVIQVNAVAAQSPIGGAIALTMIEDPAARAALGTLLKGWSEERLNAVADLWPDIAVPPARRVLAETYIEQSGRPVAAPGLLSALLRIDSYAVERLLLADLVSDAAETTRGAAPRDPNAANVWRMLGHYRNTVAVRRFLRELEGTDDMRKQLALLGLGATRDPSLVPMLAEHLKSPSGGVVFAAAQGLLAMDSSEAAAALADGLPADAAPWAVVAAAPALAAKAGPAVAARLLAKALSASLAAPSADGSAQTPADPMAPPEATPTGAVAPTRQMGQVHPGVDARIASPDQALAALAELRLATPDVRAAIEKARADRRPRVRAAAYAAKAACASSGGGSLLRGLVKLTPFGRFSGAARGAAPVSTDVAAEALKDPHPLVRAAGVRLLDGAPASSAVPLLETVVRDADGAVRAEIMKALPTLKSPDASVTRLTAAGLMDADLGVVTAAAQAAGALRSPALETPLAEALARPDVRGAENTSALLALIEAAGALGGKAATQTLALLLDSPEDPVVMAAVRAIGRIGDPTALHGLLRLARKGGAEGVQEAVFEAMTQFDTPEARESVLSTLKRTDAGLPPRCSELAGQMLVSQCGRPGPFQDWLKRPENELSEDALKAMAVVAAAAPEALHAGLSAVGLRYIGSGSEERRKAAAEILSFLPGDESARSGLFEAYIENTENLGDCLAAQFRRTRDARFLEDLKVKLRRLQRAAAAAAAAESKTVDDKKRVSERDLVLLTIAAVEGMGGIGGEEAAKELGRLTYSEKDPAVLKAVARALEATRAKEAVDYLGRMARLPGPFAIEAARALTRMAHLDPPNAQKTFERLSKDFDPALAAVGADGLDDLAARGLLAAPTPG